MPSMEQGLGLNWVLAGSKASMYTSTFPHYDNRNKTKALGYNEKGGNIPAGNGGFTLTGTNKGYLSKAATREAILGLTNGGLPDLKHRILKLETKNGNVDCNTRQTTSHGPPLLQYTNRQKALLENDGNDRIVSQKSTSSDLNYSIKETQNKNLTPSPPVERSKGRILLTRPKSSITDTSRHKDKELKTEGVLVQRHSSETRLSQDKGKDLQDPSSQWGHAVSTSSDIGINRKKPATLQWTVSSPREIRSESQDILNNRSEFSPLGPDARRYTPSPRSPSYDSDDEDVLSSNRDYIDQVAKENEAFKYELHKSLNTLLERAVQSAGPVNEKQRQNLESQFRDSSPESSPKIQSPGRTPRLESKGVSDYEELVLGRESTHSQDSGISSESVEKGLPSHTSPVDTSPVLGKKKSLKSKGKQKPGMLVDDPFYTLKPKRKKSAKQRSRRKHGKKSPQKSRQDSASNVQKKKQSREILADNMLTSQKGNGPIVNFQAYSTPMQVLPAGYRPRVDKAHIAIASMPIKSHTNAIYSKKLPRVPQPTLTFDPTSIKETVGNKIQLDMVTQSFPVHRKSVGSSSQNYEVRKSLNEAPRGHHTNATSAVPRGHHTNSDDMGSKVTKIYLSDRQSGVVNELGVDLPCAPPATPMPEILRRIEYIPSMFDIRAQRAVKCKLEVLERQEVKRREKQMATQAKNEKISAKEKEKNKKKLQRIQVYALNKAMTQFEHQNFKMFCQANGIQCEL